MAKTETIDLDALKNLLLWCRKEGISISQVSLGGIALACTDLRMTEKPGRAKLTETGDAQPYTEKDAYERYAGAAMPDMIARLATMQADAAKMEKALESNDTFEDDDD
jgi:hypothetical protein